MALSGIVLVTGGAGFIGSHIASALVESGARVRVVDNLSTGYEKNVEAIGSDVDFVKADVADDQALNKVLRDVELIFHEAAIPSVPRSVDKPTETHKASVDATFKLLLAARDQKVRRVIYAASSSAYGDQPELPKRAATSCSPSFGPEFRCVLRIPRGLEVRSLPFYCSPYYSPWASAHRRQNRCSHRPARKAAGER